MTRRASFTWLGNLPTPLTPLVGRSRESDSVCDLLRQGGRLATLTGPGGVGKTRLVTDVAARLREHFVDGVWFVPLAPVRDPSLVPAAVAAALGAHETRGLSVADSVQNRLRASETLLVLDACEHVLDAASWIGELLADCLDLKVLATSRARLRLDGEHELPVRPLALPNSGHADDPGALSGNPAVALFVERARAARPDFALADANAGAIVEICRRLDGLPLAIELAAARCKLLSPRELLDLLPDGPPDRPDHPLEVRETIAWSCHALDPAEQALLRRLSVFAGGHTLDAAEAVCRTPGDDVPNLLARFGALVDSGLVRPGAYADDSAAPEERFDMLDTIREFGREQLDAHDETVFFQRRHAEYFQRLGEQTTAAFDGPDVAVWLDRLERERANLQAALDFAVNALPGDLGLRLASSLYGFWYVRGPVSEGAYWIERALASADGCGVDRELRALALYKAGEFARVRGDHERAMERGRQSLALARDAANPAGVALATFLLANTAASAGDDQQAATLFAESLRHYRDIGNVDRVAMVLNNFGQSMRRLGDSARATMLFEEALGLWSELDAKWGIGIALVSLGEVTRDRGDHTRARARYQEALALFKELDDSWGVADCLNGLAEIAADLNQPARAARLLSAAATLHERIGLVSSPAEQERRETIRRAAEAALDPESIAAATAQGCQMSLDAAIRYALESGRASEHAGSPLAATLTARELDVLQLIAAGRSNREIAGDLDLSVRTVERHTATLYRKIGARGKAEATAWALHHGLA